MTTPTTESVPSAETAPPVSSTATTETAPPAAEPKVDTTDWKAEARKHEARAKENAAAAKRLAEIEDASKSELERANARAEAAEQRAAALESQTLRDRIAAEHNLPADLAARLVGNDVEALTADAKSLQALFKANAAPPAEVDQGVQANGTAQPVQLSSSDLVGMSPSAIEAARLRGELNTLLGIKS